MMVPPEIIGLLDGRPEINSWEPVFTLLTVDEAGFPHVCLVSRMELEADARHIYAVLAAATTTANLARRPVATLVTVHDDVASYLKLAMVRASTSMPMAVAFEVVTLTRDSLGIPLTPPRYLVTSSLPVAETWARTTELLSRFRASG
jgi:hypothetical protein